MMVLKSFSHIGVLYLEVNSIVLEQHVQRTAHHFVINWAAEFCIFWRWFSRNCGSPYSKELQLSSLLEIKAQIKISVSDFDRQFLIFTILFKGKNDLHYVWDVLLKADVLIKDSTNISCRKRGLDSICVYFDVVSHWLRTVLCI